MSKRFGEERVGESDAFKPADGEVNRRATAAQLANRNECPTRTLSNLKISLDTLSTPSSVAYTSQHPVEFLISRSPSATMKRRNRISTISLADTKSYGARRIKNAKRSAVRPARTSHAFQGIQQPMPQTFGSTNPNSNGAQQEQNTFNFGTQSQSFAGTSQSPYNAGQSSTQSASFPAFSNIAPPETPFNFGNNFGSGTSGINNPFASSPNNFQASATPSLNGGFQGTIFNIPPATPAPVPTTQPSTSTHGSKRTQAQKERNRRELESKPMWAGGVNPFQDTSSSNNGAPEEQQRFPPAPNRSDSQGAPQNQQASNFFGQSATPASVPEPKPSHFNFFGNNQPSQSSPNFFSSVPTQQSTAGQSSNLFGGSQHFLPTSNVLPASAPTQSSLNMFAPSPSQNNMFGNSQPTQSVTGQPSSGMFDTNPPQSNMFNSATSNQNMSDPFGISQGQPPVFSPFANSVFQQPASSLPGNLESQQTVPAAYTSNNPESTGPQQESSNQPTSNIFGHIQQQQSQPLSGIFGQNSSNPNRNQQATSFTHNEGDSMSTTPATSPLGAQQVSQATLASFNAPASPTPQGSTGSMFGRVPQPSHASAAPQNDQGFVQDHQGQGRSLFDRITKPDEAHGQGNTEALMPSGSGPDTSSGSSLFDRISKPGEAHEQRNTEALMPSSSAPDTSSGSSLFDRISKPSEAHGQGNTEALMPSSSAPDTSSDSIPDFGQSIVNKAIRETNQPVSTESGAPKNIFAGIMKSSPQVPQSSNGDRTPSSEDTALKSLFPGFGKRSAKPKPTPEHTLGNENRQIANPTFDPGHNEPDKPSNTFAGIRQLPASSSPSVSQSSTSPTVSKVLEAPTLKVTNEPALQDKTDSSTKKVIATSIQNKPKGFMLSRRRPGAPPSPPPEFHQEEKQQSVTGYRLKAFDAGFRKVFGFSSVEDLQSAVNYYTNRRAAIVSAADYVIPDAAGSKRKTSPPQSSSCSPAKKARFESTSTPTLPQVEADNTETLFVTDNESPRQTTSAQFSATKQLLPAKRNAEQILTTDDPHGASDSAKKSRNDVPASRSPLSPPDSSHTSNIFKSIVDSAEGESNVSPSPRPQTHWTSSMPAKAPTANMSSPVKSSAAPTKANGFGSNTGAFSNGSTGDPSTSAASQMAKPPIFGSGAPINFLSQFQQQSKKEELNKKRKLKAQDLDSDEDDTEWESQYEEEQGAKKQKLANMAKGTKYVPGIGFISFEEEQENVIPQDTGLNAESSAPSRASSVSVLDQPLKPMSNGMTNIFGHISPPGSGAEGSKTGDADDEETASEDSQSDQEEYSTKSELPPSSQISQTPSSSNVFGAFTAINSAKTTQEAQTEPSTSRSLFDRIEKDKDGNLAREINPAHEKKASTLFNVASSGSDSSGLLKAASSSPSPNTTSTSKQDPQETSSTGTSPGDHTWRTDRPIKFGTTKTQPEVQITSPSPKRSLADLFGNSSAGELSKAPVKPLLQPASLKTPDVGFGISIAKPANSLATSGVASNNASRATSPAVSSNAGTMSESGAEGVENGEEQHKQIDLTSGGPGEEDEEILFQVRAKVLRYDAVDKKWLTQGVGPIRVLRHNESGRARILMRQDPSGKIILNSALASGVTYKHENSKPKTVEVPIATDSGTLIRYLVKVGKDDDAVKLAAILEENKAAKKSL